MASVPSVLAICPSSVAVVVASPSVSEIGVGAQGFVNIRGTFVATSSGLMLWPTRTADTRVPAGGSRRQYPFYLRNALMEGGRMPCQ